MGYKLMLVVPGKLSVSTGTALIVLLGLGACQESRQARSGSDIYDRFCVNCQQADGMGIPGAFPPVYESEWVNGDVGRLIRLVLNGMQGPMTVKGERYNNVMTPHDFLDDAQIAAVLTYVRSSFGNSSGAVVLNDVTAVRAVNEQQDFWLPEELEAETGIPAPDSAAGGRLP